MSARDRDDSVRVPLAVVNLDGGSLRDVLAKERDRILGDVALVRLVGQVVATTKLLKMVDARAYSQSASGPIGFKKLKKEVRGIVTDMLNRVVARCVDIVAHRVLNQQVAGGIIKPERVLKDGRQLLGDALGRGEIVTTRIRMVADEREGLAGAQKAREQCGGRELWALAG